MTHRRIPFWIVYPLAICAGYLCMLAAIPLPWMVGSIFCVAALSLGVGHVQLWGWGRRVGMIVVGACLGLYFTPSALEKLITHLGWILGAVCVSLSVAAWASFLLVRTAKLDSATAFLSSVPGGVAEMCMLGERYGASQTTIAVSQLLRIVLLVSVLPSLLLFNGVAVVSQEVGLSAEQWATLMILFLCSGIATLMLSRMGMLNAWLLMPISMGMLACSLGWHSALAPGFVTAIAQILIGVQLGSTFHRQAILSLRHCLPAIFMNILLIASACALIGVVVALATGISIPNLILATSPGGITEMSLTAKSLGLDVPMVVGFHIVRVFVFLLITPYLFIFLHRLGVLRITPSGD
jgi:membrane AbrB-like protein